MSYIQNIRGLTLLVFSFLLFSCATKPPIATDWPPEKNAIRLHIMADPELNRYDGTPHTLLLCLYQMESKNSFNQLAEDKDGIYELLECTLFDASVVRTKRLIVHPGQDSTTDIDRAEGAKYVGVVAGYFLLERERIVRLFDVPLIIEKKGWKRVKYEKPDMLNIELALGPEQIHSNEGK
jgi:type VI secretion system VasD/TssJ family lipoprotein